MRPSTRHKEVFQKLHKKFVSARSKGLRISHAWFYANANRINKEVNGSEATHLPKSSVTRFNKTYKIKLRRVQRKKNKLTKLIIYWLLCGGTLRYEKV